MLFLLSSSSSSLLLLSLSSSSSSSYYHYCYHYYHYYYYYHYYSVNNIPYQCDINCAGHFTLDALASRTVACRLSKAIIHRHCGRQRVSDERPFSVLTIRRSASQKFRSNKYLWVNLLRLTRVWPTRTSIYGGRSVSYLSPIFHKIVIENSSNSSSKSYRLII